MYFTQKYNKRAFCYGRRWWISVVSMITIVAGLLWPAAPAPHVAKAQVVDEEIVYIDSAGVIKVIDPTLSGEALIDWQSDEGGFFKFALGDFNNDGDFEIAALQRIGSTGKLVVYDPVVSDSSITPSGETPNGVPWRRLYEESFPYTPLVIGAGNMDAGIPGDEIIYGWQTGFERSEIKVLKGNSLNPDGTGWLQHIPAAGTGIPYEWTWDQVTVGQIDGSGTDEVILIDPSVDEDLNIRTRFAAYRVDDGGLSNTSPFYQKTSGGSWRRAVIGQVRDEGTNEVVAIRKTSTNGPSNLIIFKYSSSDGLAEKDENDLLFFNPRPSRVWLADINGPPAGGVADEEIFFLRDASGDSPRMIVINRGTDSIPKDRIDQRLGGDNQWSEGAGGDTDGDGKDEVIILRNDRIRIYNDPVGDMNNISEFAISAPGDDRQIRTADLDRNGFSAGAEIRATVTGIENGVAVGSQSSFQILVESSGDNIPFTIAYQNKPEWISNLPINSGTTPSLITLTVDARDLIPGNYVVNLIIRSTSSTVDIVNSPLSLSIPIEIKPATVTVVPATVTFADNTCELPSDPVSQTLRIQGTQNISYTAIIAQVPAVQAAQQILGGAPTGGRLISDTVLELKGLNGSVTTLEVQPQPEVRASAVNIDWTSDVSWLAARSDDGNILDTLTLTTNPDALFGTNGSAVLPTGEGSVRALLIIIADPRAGNFPDNVRFVPVIYMCADTQVFMPVIQKANPVTSR